MLKPNFNSAPKQSYEISLTVKDAPGAFANFRGFSNYDIANRTCLPPADNFQGTQNAQASMSIPISFTKTDDGRYVGMASADAIVDEDYYGHGICHWMMSTVHVRLAATGSAGDSEFIAEISQEQVKGESAVTRYYLKQFYPSVGGTSLPDHGTEDPVKRNPSIPPDGWFSMTLSAKSVAP